jgi:hypothetical protein
VTVRSRSTRTVDLVCEFPYRGSGSGVVQGWTQELRTPGLRNPDTARTIGSREAHSRRSRRGYDFRVGDP